MDAGVVLFPQIKEKIVQSEGGRIKNGDVIAFYVCGK